MSVDVVFATPAHSSSSVLSSPGGRKCTNNSMDLGWIVPETPEFDLGIDHSNCAENEGLNEATEEATAILCRENLEESLMFDEDAGLDEEDADIFMPVNEEELQEVNAGGRNRSAASERWFKRRFAKWQHAHRFHVGVEPEHLPLHVLENAMVPFILSLKKLNNKLYPSSTLAHMFGAAGQLIRREQTRRICETRIDETPTLLQTHGFFEKARRALVIAMDRSIKSGANKPRHKSVPVMWHSEVECLADADHQISHPTGLQKRWCYYCLSRFLVRGYLELYKLEDIDFTFGEDVHGEYVRYSERDSKNYKASMTKFQEEHFRAPVSCHEEDVVRTYKQLIRHLPPKEDPTVGRHIFLQAIRGNCRTNAWYNTNNVGVKVLTTWTKNMLMLVGTEGDHTNKSPRYSTIQHMIQAGVPSHVGMAISGHKSEHSYRRYDQTIETQKLAAMDIIARPFDCDGKRRKYEEVFEEFDKKGIKYEIGRRNLVMLTESVSRSTNLNDAARAIIETPSQVAAVTGPPLNHEKNVNDVSIRHNVSCERSGIGFHETEGAASPSTPSPCKHHPTSNFISTRSGSSSGSPICTNLMCGDKLSASEVSGNIDLDSKKQLDLWKGGIEEDIGDLFSRDLDAIWKEWPEAEKAFGCNVSTSTTTIGQQFGNFSNCTVNFTLDPIALKNLLGLNSG